MCGSTCERIVDGVWNLQTSLHSQERGQGVFFERGIGREGGEAQQLLLAQSGRIIMGAVRHGSAMPRAAGEGEVWVGAHRWTRRA